MPAYASLGCPISLCHISELRPFGLAVEPSPVRGSAADYPIPQDFPLSRMSLFHLCVVALRALRMFQQFRALYAAHFCTVRLWYRCQAAIFQSGGSFLSIVRKRENMRSYLMGSMLCVMPIRNSTRLAAALPRPGPVHAYG